MWKGGKLRLEKAKEHYLVKLKREWQEESERASKASDNSNADAAINHDTSEKPKRPTPADKPQINLFFPKLGKVIFICTFYTLYKHTVSIPLYLFC